MEKKCDKYKTLFMFSDEKSLMKHIEQCEDCKKEHEMMNNISELIQEAKPLYLKDKKQKENILKLKVACILACALFSGMVFQYFNVNYDVMYQFAYNDISIEEMGFPVDEYGFIMVD